MTSPSRKQIGKAERKKRKKSAVEVDGVAAEKRAKGEKNQQTVQTKDKSRKRDVGEVSPKVAADSLAAAYQGKGRL
jgi:hypothetical protein